MSAIESVTEFSRNRDKRVRELKYEGKKIIGYICCYVPPEIIAAANCVPYRIGGDLHDPVLIGDSFLEQTCCPYVRSCFNIGVKGGLDFLDGFVAPHSCHNIEGIYDIWTYNIKTAFSHFIDVPHTIAPSCHVFFREELSIFKDAIGDFAGLKVSNQKLHESIEHYNRNRALFRQMYDLRKQEPPLLLGSEVTNVIISGMSIPVEECSTMLISCIEEATSRLHCPERKSARVMVMGSHIDNAAFIELVEQCGANVVVDDLGVGTRSYWHDVEITDNPLDGLATRYLDKVMCPRMYRCSRTVTNTRQDNLRERFGYIVDFARDFDVDGVIIYLLRYCDPLGYEVPDLEDYLHQAGLRVLCVEDDYFMTAREKLRTKLETFVDMIVR
jgi:benzoyl-CoA reductase subunit C